MKKLSIISNYSSSSNTTDLILTEQERLLKCDNNITPLLDKDFTEELYSIEQAILEEESNQEEEIIGKPFLDNIEERMVGESLKARLKYNKSLPPRETIYNLYLKEKDVIVHRSEYLGTKPDKEIRWAS